MSSSGPGGPGDKKDEPKGLKKFIRRASLVLRPKSKRQSVSGASAFAPKDSGTGVASGSTAAASPSVATTTPDATLLSSVPAQPTQATKDSKPASTPIKPRVAMTAKEASALQEEKARAMFAKYGLTLEPGEWATPLPGDIPRIEKQVRMRVRRACHRCQVTFGHDKLCANCGHTRCKKCPRFPGSKPRTAKGKGVAAGGVGEALTMQDRGTGKEMTRKMPMQRVRRTCHECQTLFVGKAVQCESCKHLRCPKCPRDPPKQEKYLGGYPGDTLEDSQSGEKVKIPRRSKSRWNCEKCATLFKDREKTCANCGHEKCDSCPRTSPAQKPKPEDEGAIRSVEERMRNLDVSPQASAA